MHKHLMRLHSISGHDNLLAMPGLSADAPEAGVTDEQLVDQWRRLLLSYNKVSGALDKELHTQNGIGLSEYEALERVIDIGDKCLMKALGTDMYLSQSALSRAVARLERDGLVERGMCNDDRRSIYVQATDAGHTKYAEAKRTHRRVLAEYLGSNDAEQCGLKHLES